MLGKTHSIAGFGVGLLLSQARAVRFPVINEYAVLGIVTTTSVIGSLTPDIDISGSTASRFMPFISKAYKTVYRLLKVKCLDHRCLTHSIFLPLILFCVCIFVPTINPYLILALLGYSAGHLSHSVLDMLNYTGVGFFSPLCNKKIRLVPKFLAVDTGGAREVLFRLFLVVGIFCYAVFYRFREQTQTLLNAFKQC